MQFMHFIDITKSLDVCQTCDSMNINARVWRNRPAQPTAQAHTSVIIKKLVAVTACAKINEIQITYIRDLLLRQM